jgi:hypothetical protein
MRVLLIGENFLLLPYLPHPLFFGHSLTMFSSIKMLLPLVAAIFLNIAFLAIVLLPLCDRLVFIDLKLAGGLLQAPYSLF